MNSPKSHGGRAVQQRVVGCPVHGLQLQSTRDVGPAVLPKTAARATKGPPVPKLCIVEDEGGRVCRKRVRILEESIERDENGKAYVRSVVECPVHGGRAQATYNEGPTTKRYVLSSRYDRRRLLTPEQRAKEVKRVQAWRKRRRAALPVGT